MENAQLTASELDLNQNKRTIFKETDLNLTKDKTYT